MLRTARFPFAVVAALAVVVGCATPDSNTSEVSSSSMVTPEDDAITLRFTQNGSSSEIATSATQLSAAVARPLTNVTHDGQPVVDGAAVLALDDVTVKLVDGQSVTLVGEGSSLRGEAISASWNADHTSLTYATAAGETSIDLSSITDGQLRAKVAGYLALAGMGAAINPPGAEPAILAPLLYAGGALVVSVAACLLGNHDCANQAYRACRPRGVRANKAICGGGTDVNGAWQWGIHCSFRCR